MAGEIQIGGTTFATESGGTVTVSNVDSATNRTNLGLGSMATQAADSVSITGGTIGSGVVFPTRSDFGIIEVFDAGNPLIDQNASQDFSYTAGEPYFVMCNVNGGSNSWEYYNITTSNTVSKLRIETSYINPSIPSSGTLRITVANEPNRDVYAVLLVRMNH